MRRNVPGADGRDETRFSVAPFGGGNETPLSVAGRGRFGYWADSATVVIGSLTPNGLRLSLVDVRTGTTGRTLDLPDSANVRSTPLPNGWAWITKNRDRIVVEQDGKRHEIAKPAWFASLIDVQASADGARLLYTGWGSVTGDTLRVDVVPTAGATPTSWFTSFADDGAGMWLADGSVGVRLWGRPEAATLLKLTAPNQVQTLGLVPHIASLFSVSADLKRATIGWEEYRGDAWMYRVVKP
jgi:hypothetical protein